MSGQSKGVARTVVHHLTANRYIRVAFAYHLYREWIAQSETLLAQRRANKDLDESYWVAKLRQYAHMIDKGLQRGDFSKGHGAQAYELAKAALSHIRSLPSLQDPSVEWAIRKIREREVFQTEDSREFAGPCVRTICRHEDLLDAIKTRRCIRHYTNQPVTAEVIDKVTDVLDWSPTSCDRQTARAYATNNPDLARECILLHAGAACFSDIFAPLFLVFCADLRAYEPNEIALPYIDVSLGVQNCNLIAHTLGLSLTLLTWAQHSTSQDRELRRLLGIPTHFRIIVSAVGGYPDRGAEVPARKHKELFLVE